MRTQQATFVLTHFLVCLGMIQGGLAPWANARESSGTSVHQNPYYVGNRAPLRPAAFLKLPIGSIRPEGWLLGQLKLEAAGMTGQLPEISKWCNFEKNAWTDPAGQGHSGWEELPYWLKGFGDLGYVLKDERIIKEARKWIEAVLASQEASGWFGPRGLKTSLEGKPDLWPHMVMCNVLQSFEEYTGDPRVVPFLKRYFAWMNQQPPANFGAGYWPKIRFGDNIETIHWVYNRTGDAWLLDLARKIHENMARWDTGVINWHNVNIAQGFRAPAMFYVQSLDPAHLEAAERNYQTVMGLYGQFPGGGFAGDENCRQGYVDPRQGFETCGWVEFMHSFQMLTRISGRASWSDRCEDIAFNSFPASMTPDLKGLHYLTCANQVQLDKGNKAPGIQNGGTMFSYSPFEVYRCCQHNVSHGWPYYAEELWLATPDAGLCASLYAACEVTAKAGPGTAVRIREETDYPFEQTIRLRVDPETPAEFPLYLRVPGWCAAPSIKVNGRKASAQSATEGYVRVNRSWKKGDLVQVEFPMRTSLRRWPKNKDAVSVHYGPLTFSLKIGERWERYGTSANWPEWEVFPTTPWNYGLVLEGRDPARGMKVVRKKGPLPEQPFGPDAVPISLRAKGRKIPGWQLDHQGLLTVLQASPARTTEPVEELTLIPMGAARLRITAFPVVSPGPDGQEWLPPKKPAAGTYRASASHCFESDTLTALSDGLTPEKSGDQTLPRFTWWPRRGSREWVEYQFAQPKTVDSVAVYWFDDTGVGSCRIPAQWRLLARQGEDWVEVKPRATPAVVRDQFNTLEFPPVTTTGLRIDAQLQPGFSAGILEWQVKGTK